MYRQAAQTQQVAKPAWSIQLTRVTFSIHDLEYLVFVTRPENVATTIPFISQCLQLRLGCVVPVLEFQSYGPKLFEPTFVDFHHAFSSLC